MQPLRDGGPNAEAVKGQHRTLGVSDVLDHVIAVAHVGGGDLRKLLSDSACPSKRSLDGCSRYVANLTGF